MTNWIRRLLILEEVRTVELVSFTFVCDKDILEVGIDGSSGKLDSGGDGATGRRDHDWSTATSGLEDVKIDISNF